MIDPLRFQIDDTVKIKVNGELSKAKIFGFEYGWSLRPPDWVYHIKIDEYSFDIKVEQQQLSNGLELSTNGIVCKVLTTNEKTKAK